MLMETNNYPDFKIGEEYGLHEFDLIPIGEFLANNNLAYYLYKYRKIRKLNIYLFYNCDILSAIYIISRDNRIVKIKMHKKLKKEEFAELINRIGLNLGTT